MRPYPHLPFTIESLIDDHLSLGLTILGYPQKLILAALEMSVIICHIAKIVKMADFPRKQKAESCGILMVNLTIQATQELSDGKYLHVSIITDRQQVIVSTNNIKAFPVNSTGYELVVVRITAGLDIGTDADNFEF